MKTVKLLLVFLLFITTIQAQTKEGIIVYERKINMHKRITDPQMRAYIPEFRTSKHELLFSDSASIYRTIPEDEMPETNEGGVRMVMRFGGGDGDELYKNFSLLQSIRQTDIGSKTYIVEDSIRTQQWKLSNETKTMMGYSCRKAIAKQTLRIAGNVRMITNTNGVSDTTKSSTSQPQQQEVEIIAWYAEEIVSPVGPENNGGLPGVILQLDINGGETVFTAVDIKKEVNSKLVKAPTKGKKITSQEYAKLMQQMIDNMQQNGGARMMRFGE